MNDYEKVHAKRFRITCDLIQKYLPLPSYVVDVGGASPLTAQCQALGHTVAPTGSQDVTEAPWTTINTLADAVLCCEVLEHLRDTPDAPRDHYTGTGVKACLGECFRILKPNGVLIATTPNVCGLVNIQHLLYMKHPFMYEPHLREMTPNEFRAFVREPGFVIEEFQTVDVWGDHGMGAHFVHDLWRILKSRGLDTSERGSCMMCVARKPN